MGINKDGKASGDLKLNSWFPNQHAAFLFLSSPESVIMLGPISG
jgi:hypothetical protein